MESLSEKFKKQLFADLKSVISLNSLHDFSSQTNTKYVINNKYLSGNISEKIEIAQRTTELYPEDL